MTKKNTEPKEIQGENLEETDVLPSESMAQIEADKPAEPKKKAPSKKGKIIGLMGIELPEGPPGSTHG